MKNMIAQRKEMIEQIQVTNDMTYETLLQHLTFLNKAIKEVDAKRKESNGPAKEFIDNNNAIAKQITGDAEDVIVEGKAKLKVYDDYKAELERQERARIEEENRIKQEAIQKKERERIQCLNIIANHANRLTKQINDALELSNGKAILNQLTTVKDDLNQTVVKLLADESMKEFHVEIEEMSDSIMALGKKVTADVKNGNYDKVETPAEIIDSLEMQKEAIQEASNEAMIETQQSNFAVGISTHSKASYRTRWTFEVADITKVPPALLQINEVAVNAWIRNMKDAEDPQLKDGNVISGIKLIEKREAVLR
jgi:hypothetical protein